ncbi:DUF559 domain-containing protein [candidate division WOR-3 bacterium]|nr:DUF559 domain-containing protein [candidate division WOR-3 bacterium]
MNQPSRHQGSSRRRRRRRPAGGPRPPAPNQAQNIHGFPLEDDEEYPGETPAERELWKQLHRLNSDDCKFTRGHHVGQHLACFACPEKRLAIEVITGPITGEQRGRDNELIGFGWRTLRFTESEVQNELAAVLALVENALKSATRPPAPQPNKLRRFGPPRRFGPDRPPRQPGQHRGDRRGRADWNR